MNEPVTFRSKSMTRPGGDPHESSGSLIRIYPTDGGCSIWPLNRSETCLGRSRDCEVYLEDSAASGRHAVIRQEDDGYVLEDLDSTHGTFVNNEPVRQHRLAAGDRIRIGGHVLKYLSADHVELQYHEAMFHMMTRDELTEAYNRRYLIEFLDRELSRSAERSRPISIALLDIDFFKRVNDQHGHLVGDEVLRELCHRAKRVLHAGDLFARFGGEEFCAVLCECDAPEAVVLAENIRHAIADTRFVTDAGDLTITVSAGVATWMGNTKQPITTDQILKSADTALYEAKKLGRNQVCTACL